MSEQRYYIASIKHTGKEHEHIAWWGRDHRGYTPVVGEYIGAYTIEDARKLNDGYDCIAVPVESVLRCLSPEPYFRPQNPARFYDQRGPVVENSRARWKELVIASLGEGRTYVPKPEVFRGKRRAFAVVEVAALARAGA
jgi:hypothetical protein